MPARPASPPWRLVAGLVACACLAWFPWQRLPPAPLPKPTFSAGEVSEFDRLEGLIARQPKLPDSGVPMVIHQSWRTLSVDRHMGGWIQSWRSWHASPHKWLHILWTDAMLDLFVHTRMPQSIQRVYTGYPLAIQRADLTRVLLLQRYGGLYADADFECRLSFHDILNSPRLVDFERLEAPVEAPVTLQSEPLLIDPVGHHGPAAFVVESPYKRNENFQNSLMASTQNHTFWHTVVQLMLDRGEAVLDLSSPAKVRYDVLGSTGPLVIDDAMISWGWLGRDMYAQSKNSDGSRVYILPADQFFRGRFAYHHLRNSYVQEVSKGIDGSFSLYLGALQIAGWLALAIGLLKFASQFIPRKHWRLLLGVLIMSIGALITSASLWHLTRMAWNSVPREVDTLRKTPQFREKLIQDLSRAPRL